MYFRIYSHCLDYNKNWYAYNDLLFGYPKSNRKHERSAVFQLYPDEVKKVNIADLQDRNGKQPSYRWFNGRVQKAKDVYAITSFGIFLLAVRQPKSKSRMAGIQRVSEHQQYNQHSVLRTVQWRRFW